MEGITPEMIALLNTGDKRELRAFLKVYARPVYERALAITGSETDAIRVTRRVAGEVAVLALRGKLEEDIDAQLMTVTDACCSEDLFFARIVEDTLSELPDSGEEQRFPAAKWSTAPGAGWEGPIKERQPQSTARQAVAQPAVVPTVEPQQATEPQREAEPEREAKPEREAQAGWQPDMPLYQVQPGPSGAQAYSRPAAHGVPSLFDEGGDAELELEEDLEDEAEHKPSVWIVLLIFVLSLITLALVWVLVVKLMTIGVLPLSDFGFAQWFNANVFRLY